MEEEKLYEIVEEGLRKLTAEPESMRGELPGQWSMQMGDMAIWVDVWKHEKDDNFYFQVLAPFMTIPEGVSNEALYKELLEINNVMFAVAFALNDNALYLRSITDAAGLTVDDVTSVLNYCAFYTDFYEKRLIDKYGGKKMVFK